VGNFGKEEKEIAGAARDEGKIARFQTTAPLEQIDERVMAVGAQVTEGHAPAMSDVASQRNLAELTGEIGLQDKAGPRDRAGHTKTYMFFAKASIEDDRR
jgi:hypothetical protein